jgi:pimeloyl-ACP methyl ester carboxylesterase
MVQFSHNTGSFLETEGAKIYYEELGDKNSPALLMLHGGFGTIEDFNPIVPTLVKKFRLIAMDARGQGKSTLGQQRLTYQQMQLDAELLLSRLGIKEVIVIGFSDGGMVAQRMAISSAVTIKKLILIGTPWTFSDLKDISTLLSKVTPESWKEKFPESYNFYKRLNPEIDFEVLTKELKTMWLDEGTTGGYLDRRVKGIACPTLIIRGDEDHLFSGMSASLLANGIHTSSVLNVPFAGHEVHKDAPEVVGSFIDHFLTNR